MDTLAVCRFGKLRHPAVGVAGWDVVFRQSFVPHHVLSAGGQGEAGGPVAQVVQSDWGQSAGLDGAPERDAEPLRLDGAPGLIGQDGPVTANLLPLIEDDFGTVELYAPYLAQLVARDRRDIAPGCVSFYGEVCDDTTPPAAPRTRTVSPSLTPACWTRA